MTPRTAALLHKVSDLPPVHRDSRLGSDIGETAAHTPVLPLLVLDDGRSESIEGMAGQAKGTYESTIQLEALESSSSRQKSPPSNNARGSDEAGIQASLSETPPLTTASSRELQPKSPKRQRTNGKLHTPLLFLTCRLEDFHLHL